MAEEILAFEGGAVLTYLLIRGKKVPVLVPKQTSVPASVAQELNALANYSQVGRSVVVSNVAPATVLVQPDQNQKVRAITVTNLDLNNKLHFRLGGQLTASEGHLLYPLNSAFFSVLFGETPWVGLWGISENAPITCEVTS